MCQAGMDYKPGLYTNWEGRIEHLEKTRYLLLGGEIAVLTYVLNYVMLTDHAKLNGVGLLLLHATAAAFAIVIAQLIANVSRGAHMAATELMLLEYQMGVVSQGSGYYARRAGKRRHAFRILPVAGDLLAVIFIAASWWYQQLTTAYPASTTYLFLMLLTTAVYFAWMNYQRAESMLAQKDRLDLFCQRALGQPLDEAYFKALCAEKWPQS
jgi:hypothetical protein